MNWFLTSVCDSVNRRGAVRSFRRHDLFRQCKTDPRLGLYHLPWLWHCKNQAEFAMPESRNRCTVVLVTPSDFFTCEPGVSGKLYHHTLHKAKFHGYSRSNIDTQTKFGHNWWASTRWTSTFRPGSHWWKHQVGDSIIFAPDFAACRNSLCSFKHFHRISHHRTHRLASPDEL